MMDFEDLAAISRRDLLVGTVAAGVALGTAGQSQSVQAAHHADALADGDALGDGDGEAVITRSTISSRYLVSSV